MIGVLISHRSYMFMKNPINEKPVGLKSNNSKSQFTVPLLCAG